MVDVSKLSFEERLGEVIERTTVKVGPEVANQLRALVEPRALKIMAGVLLAWVVSHGFGFGEAVDIVIGVVGIFAIGLSIFSGLDELIQFGLRTHGARGEADLNAAAEHLAKAIGILGIQAVLAVLFRGRPATRRQGVRSPPPATPGWGYRPRTRGSATRRAGEGETSWWGDIEFSTQGPASEQALVLFHERVHQILTPKLYPLRNYRVGSRVGSYTGSSLFRYLEEMLAETIAQTRVNGAGQLFLNLKFPVKYGYVYWLRAGADAGYIGWTGRGIIPEGAGLIASGLMAGIQMQLWYKAGDTASPPRPDARPMPIQTPGRR